MSVNEQQNNNNNKQQQQQQQERTPPSSDDEYFRYTLDNAENKEEERKRIKQLLDDLPETGIQVPDPSDRTNRKAASKPGHIKRPLNAFMIYSMVKRRELTMGERNILHKELSQSLGETWKSLTAEERNPYSIEAERARLRHMYEHPYYRYRPKRKRNTNTTTTSSSSTSSSSSSYVSKLTFQQPNSKRKVAKASTSSSKPSIQPPPTNPAVASQMQPMFSYVNPTTAFMNQLYSGAGGGTEAGIPLQQPLYYPSSIVGHNGFLQASLMAKAAQQLQQEQQQQQQAFTGGNIAAMIQAAMMYSYDMMRNNASRKQQRGSEILPTTTNGFAPLAFQQRTRGHMEQAANSAAAFTTPQPVAPTESAPIDFSVKKKKDEPSVEVKTEREDHFV